MNVQIHIDIGDKKSIDSAIQTLLKTQSEIEDRTKVLVATLAERGASYAKENINMYGAIDTGELYSSTTYVTGDDGLSARVYSDAPHAQYVEYGTGIIGSAMPHPEPEGWVYDINGHGAEGWVYFNSNDGKLHWTNGYVARPFMYEARTRLEEEAESIARGVFR